MFLLALLACLPISVLAKLFAKSFDTFEVFVTDLELLVNAKSFTLVSKER